MSLHAGSGPRHLPHQIVIDQKALHQRPDGRILDAEQNFPDAIQQLLDVGSRLKLEVFGVDSLCRLLLDARDNDLQAALKELNFAFDLHVVARVETRAVLLDDVPHQAADRPRTIAKLREQIQVRVAVGPQLLFGQQVNFLNRVTVLEVADELSRH